jgi:hypothetical protein
MNTVLWNPANHSYDWAKHEDFDKESVPCHWDVLYPDSVEQAWAVAYGVPPDRATSAALMDTFWQNHGGWSQPAATDTYYDAGPPDCQAKTCDHPVEYWPLAGNAFIRAGNPTEAAVGAKSIHDGAIAAHRQRPFSVGWAGMLLRLEALVMQHR